MSLAALKDRLTRLNPRAPAALRRRRYYHGTQDPYAEAVLVSGALLPRSDTQVLEQDRSWLAPVPGYVYVSPDPLRAARYLELTRDGQHPVGLLVEVDARDLVQVEPDEDDVGRAIYVALTGEVITPHRPFERAVQEKAWASGRGRATFSGLVPTSWGNYLRHVAEKALTTAQFRDMGGWHGEPAVPLLAKVGKKILPRLDDQVRLDLLEMGSDVAHEGPLPIQAAYLCDIHDVDRALSWRALKRACTPVRSAHDYLRTKTRVLTAYPS